MTSKEEGTIVDRGYIYNNNHAASRFTSVAGPGGGFGSDGRGVLKGSGEGQAFGGENSPRPSPPSQHDSPDSKVLGSNTATNHGKPDGSTDERCVEKVVQDDTDVSAVGLEDSGVDVSVCPATGLGGDTSAGHPLTDTDEAVSTRGQLAEDISGQPDDKMKTCNCDEATLCFCTSSAFCPRQTASKGSKPPQAKRGPPSEFSSTGVPQIETDDVFVKDCGVQHGPGGGIIPSIPVEDSEDVKKCKTFMEDLVDRIFNNSASICQEDNANFGEYCQSAVGRQWFARLIDSQRVHSKKVTEQTFYRLVQFFAVCLFECSIADDFTPGKSLMNMCFTFYHEHEGFPRSDDTTQKSFLFTHLMEQPIWKSLRFWDAAFFDAVHQERKQRAPDNQVNWRHLSSEERENTEILNENIAFGQLATFLHNMMELELSREMCQQFLDKMATIGNLSSDQRDLIQSSLGNHFHDDAEEHPRQRRLQKPLNKLIFLKRKSRQESAS